MFSFVFLNCKNVDNEPVDDKMGTNVRIIINFDEYARIMNGRTSYKGNFFDIKNMERNGKYLKIEVTN